MTKKGGDRMAEKIHDDNWKAKVPSRKYPWWQWMDGSTWKARKGKDYHLSSKSFAGGLRRRANKYNLGVTIEAYEDFVIFRFRNRDGSSLKEEAKSNVRELRPRKFNFS